MRVKICGITRIEDAVAARDHGAFAVGFICWPGSPRYIDAARARTIGESLPRDVLKVGVFVDQPLDSVRRVATEAAVDIVQLHGDEGSEYALALDWPVWKSVPVADGFSVAALDDVPPSITILLDAHDPVKRGGTGRTIDWTAAAAAAASRPVILSGGINPANIGGAASQVRPYAIDVSSGVESSPGIKDHRRIAELFEALRT